MCLMLEMRPATSADQPAVTEMILARCAWMEERGLPSWRENAEDLAAQCVNPCDDVWLLVMDGRVVGRTTLQEQAPPWGWTDAELAEPFLYLNTSVTDPAYRDMRLGTLMAWWAVDRAARQGARWVGRDCLWPQLARYYETQGFTLVREVERGRHRLHLLARRAEPIEAVGEWLRTGTPALPGVGR
jgi:GNAT superfamily N-acetyltransferase